LLIHDDPVQEGIFDLKPETTYRFRVLATSHCHEAEPSELCEATGDTGEFTTLPPISVRNFTTQTVAPEEVTIKAELNNNNSLGAGHYTIRFGTDTSYATGQREGSLQGGSGDYEAVEASFTGLNPNTEYHYQLFGENEYGQVETADRTLTTERSAPEERAGEDCPLNGTVHGDLKSPLREEDNSTSLPDCRSYEQVSPAYKAGFPAVQPRLAPSGEAARFSSPGAFAGSERDYYAAAEYAARRTGSGWRTVAVAGEGASLPGYRPGEAVNFTAELDHWLVPMQPGLDGEEALSTGRPGFFSLGSIDGSYVTPASPPLEPFEVPVAQDGLARFFYQLTGASDDLSHVYIATERRLLRAPADPRPEGKQDAGGGKSNRIYELTGAGGGDPVLRLLAEVPTGLTHSSCVIDPFGHEDGAYPGRHTSADGSTFLYANQIEDEAGKPCGEGTPNPTGLFVRALPAAPQQLNVAPPAQCHAPSPCATAPTSTADSVGISGDGSRAWFMTSQPLVEADRDSSQDLYVADLGEEGSVGSLVQASAGEATATHPEPGTGAGVQGVAALSSGTGASNVAFVATGVLTEAPNQLGQVAKPGADNLYLYDAETGATKFVADLCSQAGLSGSSSDDACPNQFISSEGQGGNPGDTSLWRPHIEARQLPQMTPDGRYLIFATYARLVADDTDSVRDIYRFDLSTGSLIRVSFGRDGNDGDGNDDAFPVQIEASGGISYGTDSEPDHAAQDESRAISADGSRVVFSTKAPLVSADTDGSSDVYEWEEDGHGSCTEARGCVYLISSGRDRHGANSPVISSSGRDIAFYSAAGLLPADTDGLGDIYDARVDGGFPRAFEPATCDGPESCRGAATAPSALPSFTTAATQHEPEAIPCGKGRHRVRKHNEVRCVRNKGHRKKHRSKHRRSHRHGRAGAKHGGVR
jgi:hypothetical protein